jgi:urease accessory protein
MTTITTTSTSTSGALRLRVERRGERSALVEASGHVPYAPRPAPGRDGFAKVVLVATVAGPLAGDRLEVDVEVGERAALEVVGNAATVALPAAVPARIEIRIRLAAGAQLRWLPEPLILARGCDLESSLLLELDTGAVALTRELVVLGRHGEEPGRYRSELRCELEGRPLLHEAIEIGGGVHESAAVLGEARAFGSMALLGRRAGSGGLELDGPGRVWRALARDAATLTEVLGSCSTT